MLTADSKALAGLNGVSSCFSSRLSGGHFSPVCECTQLDSASSEPLTQCPARNFDGYMPKLAEALYQLNHANVLLNLHVGTFDLFKFMGNAARFYKHAATVCNSCSTITQASRAVDLDNAC